MQRIFTGKFLSLVYIGDLDEGLIWERDKKPDLWVHYIDDIFMIWWHTPGHLDMLLQELNTRQEKIKFIAKVNTQHCNFLDLTMYKSPTFLTTGLLSTKIYYKPINTFSFLLGSSHIPKYVIRCIAISEMTRMLKNTKSTSLYRLYSNKVNNLDGGSILKTSLKSSVKQPTTGGHCPSMKQRGGHT